MAQKLRQTPRDASAPTVPRDVFVSGRLRVDAAARTAMIDGAPIELQPKVFDLLVILLREPGIVHTREALFQRLWPGTVVLDGNLTSALSQLRRAVDDDTRAGLRTVPRVGYAFDGEVQRLDGETAARDEAGRAADPEGDATGDAVDAEAPAPFARAATRERRSAPARGWAMAAAALVAMAVVAVVARWPTSPHRPIVVLAPVTASTPEADARWVGMALRDAFLRRLDGDPALRVVEGGSVAATVPFDAEADAEGADIALKVSYGPADGPEALALTVVMRSADGDLSTLRRSATRATLVAEADALALAVRDALLPGSSPPDPAARAIAPEAVQAYVDGLRALDQMRLREARAHFERAVERSPGFVQAELRLADVLRREGFHALAAGVYRRLATEAVDGSEARLLAGARADALEGDVAAAARAYARLVARYPDDPRHGVEWARVLARDGAEGRAAAWRVLDTLGDAPGLPDAAVRRALVEGLLLEHEGRHAEAAARFAVAQEKAIAAGLTALAGDAALERGRMHQRQGQREAARSSWQQARDAYAAAALPLDRAAAELNLLLMSRFDDPPADPAAVRAGIEAFAARARDLGAIEFEAQTLLMLAENRSESDDPGAAEEAAALAAARFATLGNRFDAARARIVVARARLAQGRAGAALGLLDEVDDAFVAGAPEHHEIARVRVQALLDSGAPAQARREADAAVAALALSGNAELLALARCVQVNALRATGAEALARAALDDCMAWRGGETSPNLQLVAADLALAAGDVAALRRHLDLASRGLDATPERSAARNRLERAAASLLLRAGAFDAAKARLARVDAATLAGEPDHHRRDHALLQALVSAYVDRNGAEARRWLAESRRITGPDGAPATLVIDLVDVALADPVRDAERRRALLDDVIARAAAIGDAPTQRLVDRLASAVATAPDRAPDGGWLREPLPAPSGELVIGR